MPNPEKFNDDLTNEYSRRGFCKSIDRALELIEEQKTEPKVGFQEKMDALSGFMDSCARGFLLKDSSDVNYNDSD